MTTLVITAHPDDEVLGCGGTIARKTARGSEVRIAILGEGLTSRAEDHDAANTEELEALHECSRESARILGAAPPFQYDSPDYRSDEVAILEVAKCIEAIFKNTGADEIFTQHGGDLNIDHVITFRATLIDTRPMLGRRIRAVYGCEVPSSTEWAFTKFEPRFSPDHFVDINDALAREIDPLAAYESESRDFPHPRSPKALEAIARRWGSVVGVEAAEAFETIWRVE